MGAGPDGEPGLGLGGILISFAERARAGSGRAGAWLEERSPSYLKGEPGLGLKGDPTLTCRERF